MKYVFFTGATGDLGRACVRRLSDGGRWTVFAAGTSGEKLAELGALPNVIPIRCDLSDPADVEAAKRIVASRTDILDAIVNFAGLTAFLSAVEGDIIPVTEKILDINVMGMVRVNRIFFGMLRQPGGRILNGSSEAGWMTPQPFASPYFLSKRAVEAYSDSLRRELMFLGIRVVKIQPGSFRGAMTGRIRDDYEQAVRGTDHFRDLLIRMKPLMTHELSRPNDPARLARTVEKALEAKNPRLRYRVGTGKLLAALGLLPERWIDAAYRLVFTLRGTGKRRSSGRKSP